MGGNTKGDIINGRHYNSHVREDLEQDKAQQTQTERHPDLSADRRFRQSMNPDQTSQAWMTVKGLTRSSFFPGSPICTMQFQAWLAWFSLAAGTRARRRPAFGMGVRASFPRGILTGILPPVSGPGHSAHPHSSAWNCTCTAMPDINCMYEYDKSISHPLTWMATINTALTNSPAAAKPLRRQTIGTAGYTSLSAFALASSSLSWKYREQPSDTMRNHENSDACEHDCHLYSLGGDFRFMLQAYTLTMLPIIRPQWDH